MKNTMLNLVAFVCTIALYSSAAAAAVNNMACDVSYGGISENISLAPGKVVTKTFGDFGDLNFQNYEGGTMILFLNQPGFSLQIHSGDAALTLPNPKGDHASLALRCVLKSI